MKKNKRLFHHQTSSTFHSLDIIRKKYVSILNSFSRQNELQSDHGIHRCLGFRLRDGRHLRDEQGCRV